MTLLGKMTPVVFAILLAGCRCGGTAPAPEEPAAAPSFPAPAPPSGVQPEVVPTIFEEVAATATVATGLRVRPDGLADLAVGTPGKLVWTPVNQLGDEELETFRRELASEELAGVPDDLVPVPGTPDGAPSSEFHVDTPKGPRTIRVATSPARRIPVLERLARLARGSDIPPIRTRWQAVRAGVGTTFDVPCDPGRVEALKPLVEVLRSPGVEQDRAVDSPSPVRLRVTWGTGSRVWETVVHDDGLLVRGTEAGDVAGFRLHDSQLARLRQELDALQPEALACP